MLQTGNPFVTLGIFFCKIKRKKEINYLSKKANFFRIYRRLSALPFWNQPQSHRLPLTPLPPEDPRHRRRCLTIAGTGLTIEVGSRGGRRLVFGPRRPEASQDGPPAGRLPPRRVTLPISVGEGGGGRSARRRLLRSGGRRGNRTLYLLICVVVVFVISWLPLNSLNLLLDLGFREHLFG